MASRWLLALQPSHQTPSSTTTHIHHPGTRQEPPWKRGTIIGSLGSVISGMEPTIASFLAYASEKKLSRTSERFGHGAIEGVACPEAATHASVECDFIPTMSLGIPGDAVMALLLGALLTQGTTPGPQLISEHADIF